MDERIIDLSEERASLSVRNQQLVIKRDEREVTFPLEETAVLIVSHPAVHYTHAVLAGICANGGSFVICNEKRMPIGMMLPLTGHFIQTERIAAQAGISLPVKKQLWRQVVQAKIMAQARQLERATGRDHGLAVLARRVKSGDPSNVEGQAARRYWPALFGSVFQRIPGADDPVNRLLNYGYAVLRGIVTRSLCASGLHPSLGIHHHNRYNPFCLADDIMEPFRPLVDASALRVVLQRGSDVPLDKDTKAVLIGSLMTSRFTIEGETRSLFDVAARTAASLASVYTKKRKKLVLPEL